MAGGRLYTEDPATISHVTCNGRIRSGFAGELRAAIVDTDRICLELDSVKAKAHLLAEGLLVRIVVWDEGRPRIEALKAYAKDLHIQ